ncbi:MAG: biopolymer transporter Tol [Bacillota bacterium]
MLKKLILLTLVVILAIGMTACGDQEFMTLRGQVIDRFSGKPLAGVDVEVGNRIVQTDEQGNFLVEDIPVVDDIPVKDRMLKVASAGYRTYANPLTLEEGDKLLDIKLESKLEVKFFFVKDDDGQDIYQTDVYGEQINNLTDNQANDWAPNWSAKEERLLFLSDRDGPTNIYAMDADGSNLEQITSTKTNKESPVWLGEDQVLFASDRDGDFDIYLMDLSKGYLKRLTNNEYYDGQLSYSANREEIAYISETTGNPKLHLMNTEGDSKVKLNQGYGSDSNPQWIDDQIRISFNNIDGDSSKIKQINPNGSGLKKIKEINKEITDFAVYDKTTRLILYVVQEDSNSKLKLSTEQNQERAILSGEDIEYSDLEWKN